MTWRADLEYNSYEERAKRQAEEEAQRARKEAAEKERRRRDAELEAKEKQRIALIPELNKQIPAFFEYIYNVQQELKNLSDSHSCDELLSKVTVNFQMYLHTIKNCLPTNMSDYETEAKNIKEEIKQKKRDFLAPLLAEKTTKFNAELDFFANLNSNSLPAIEDFDNHYKMITDLLSEIRLIDDTGFTDENLKKQLRSILEKVFRNLIPAVRNLMESPETTLENLVENALSL